jgi:hypothetical protein
MQAISFLIESGRGPFDAPGKRRGFCQASFLIESGRGPCDMPGKRRGFCQASFRVESGRGPFDMPGKRRGFCQANSWTIAALIAAAALTFSGCSASDAKSAWNDIVKKCAKSDLNAKEILYFGPSNNVGPASIWRTVDTGGYRLRWTSADMPGAEVAVLKGNEMSCQGTAKHDFSGKASAGLVTSITPASGEVAAEFGRARKVTVNADALAWDTLKEGPFEQYVRGLPDTNPIKQELGTNTRLVSVRALRVQGFSAELEFTATEAASLKAKYQGALPAQLTGELNAGLQGQWKNETTLKITAQDFYIAGEFGQYRATGFAAAEGAVSDAIEIKNRSDLGREQP